MVDAAKLLGVDVMTGHWEFTYGAQRVREIVDRDFAGRVDFIAQNVRTADFGDPVFEPYVIKTINGIAVAILGQAFPYVPIAHPRYFVPDWTFGIQEETMQKAVDSARGKGAQAVVLLSHNGMDVDLKLASRVSGIDVVLGGHTHDAVPQPTIVSNRAGKTVVTNAGCNGKFVGGSPPGRNGKLADFVTGCCRFRRPAPADSRWRRWWRAARTLLQGLPRIDHRRLALSRGISTGRLTS
jgi:sulfur-oxidizing protein SoxB